MVVIEVVTLLDIGVMGDMMYGTLLILQLNRCGFDRGRRVIVL